MQENVALYFVASPLQYLAARRIATTHEADARQILVWYKPGVTPIVQTAEWDGCAYMPWPRWEPLPGPFGRLRRQKANIRLVADLVGRCERLHIHSAVFDTEAINYFLRALPRRCGAGEVKARILPDGIISIRRYPLTLAKCLAQYARKLRRLLDPELDYWCFSGDRIGSDAPFCDRIYVLPGLPHEYPVKKVVTLPPLVQASAGRESEAPGERRALVIGQPLVGAGLMQAKDYHAVTANILDWLQAQNIKEIFYKPHPKDPNQELFNPSYKILKINEPLEIHLSKTTYDVVAGVRSSGLLFASQIYSKNATIAAFGWKNIIFKNPEEKNDMESLFKKLNIEIKN